MDGVSNGQRALWTFLMAMLVVPFLAALSAAAVAIVGPLVGAAVVAPGRDVGAIALGAYVWSAIPAALAAAALVPAVLRRATFGWIEAGAAGVVAFAAANVLAPLHLGALLPWAALAFGLALVALRIMLAGRILKP